MAQRAPGVLRLRLPAASPRRPPSSPGRILAAHATADGGSHGSSSDTGSGGSGSPPYSTDARKASVNELLSGVLYWRAQQIRQGRDPSSGAPPAAAAASPPPYQSVIAPPPPPPPHQQQQQPGTNGTNGANGLNGSALVNGAEAAAQPLAPSSSNSIGGGGGSGSGEDLSYPGHLLDASAAARDVSDALAAYNGAMAQHKLVAVRFCLRMRAQAGQRLKLVGACQHLGSWNLAAAPELRWAEGDTWHATVQLPAGSVTEYKYVLLDASGTRAMAWQDGNNSLLSVRLAEGAVPGGLSVYDDWYAGPGAKLAVGTEPPATRDNRLQAWAGDLFAQLEVQRQDLRRTRVELAGAQQDAASARLLAEQATAQLAAREAAAAAALQEARMAQLELQRVRELLVEKEGEQAQAVSSYTQARTLTATLQAQLADTTATLQEAVELLSAQPEEEEEEVGAGAAGPASPAPRKRRSSRKAAVPAAADAPEEEAAEEEAPAMEAPQAQVTAAKPARARRGRPSKAALAAAAAAAAEAATQPSAQLAAAARAPRARRARSAAAAEAAGEEVAAAAGAGEVRLAGAEGSLAATSKPARTRRPRSKAAAVVEPTAAAGEAVEGQAAKPAGPRRTRSKAVTPATIVAE